MKYNEWLSNGSRQLEVFPYGCRAERALVRSSLFLQLKKIPLKDQMVLSNFLYAVQLVAISYRSQVSIHWSYNKYGYKYQMIFLPSTSRGFCNALQSFSSRVVGSYYLCAEKYKVMSKRGLISVCIWGGGNIQAEVAPRAK